MKHTLHSILLILVFLTTTIIISCQSNDEDAPKEETTTEMVTDEATEVVENEVSENVFEFPKLMPVDDAYQDEELYDIIEAFKVAVASKKAKNIIPFLSENIQVSFGDEPGIESFKAFWNLNTTEADQSELWQELSNILELGGSYSDADHFAMPYTFTLFPEEYDPFEYIVITGKNVRIRDKPSLEGKVIGALSYDIVKAKMMENAIEEVIDGERHFWEKIVLPNQEVGYVYGKYARSPLSYRLGFSKINGNWLITFLVAGD